MTVGEVERPQPQPHVTATPRLDCDCESSEQGGEQSQERADAGTTCSSGFTYSRPLTLP